MFAFIFTIVLLDGLQQRRFHLGFLAPAVGAVNPLRVDCEQHLCVGMPHLAADIGRVDAVGQRVGGIGMPTAIRAPVAHLAGLQGWLPVVVSLTAFVVPWLTLPGCLLK